MASWRPPFNAPSNLIYKVATINPARRRPATNSQAQRGYRRGFSSSGWMTPGSRAFSLFLFPFSLLFAFVSFPRSPRISMCNYCSPHGLCPFFASLVPDLLLSSPFLSFRAPTLLLARLLARNAAIIASILG